MRDTDAGRRGRPQVRSVLGAMAVIISAALLAGCATNRDQTTGSVQFSSAKYGVPASPRVIAFGQEVPHGGGRNITGKPYQVAGKWYYPKEDPHYEATGLASWYGANFHGRLTANGEVYDIAGLTGAHPTMPLPSYARVTNVANGRSIIVRVNDRGPYHGNRIIDVSSLAAEMLAFKSDGVAKVHVEYLGRAPLEGDDQQTLMASYRGPGAPGGGTMLADAGPLPAASVPLPLRRPVFLASASGATKPALGFADEPATGTYSPADDPLAPLLLHGSLSYAEDTITTPAQQAIGLFVAADPVAAPGYQVQVGAFGDPANAERIARLLAPFGSAVISDVIAGRHTLHGVRLEVSAEVAPDAVIAAAAAAGATGAFVLPR